MKSKSKFLLNLAIIFGILLMSFTPVLAENSGTINTETPNKIETNVEATTPTPQPENTPTTPDNPVKNPLDPNQSIEAQNPNGIISANDVLPNAELESVVSKVEGKVGEAATAVQRILSALCIVVFLFGAGRLLFGLFGRHSWGLGVLTMALSGVAYVFINYAAPIMAWFSAWLAA